MLRVLTCLSISCSFEASNESSQPTSTRILMPPSSSRRDCEAGDEDWAPRRAVKVNILVEVLSSVAHYGGGVIGRVADGFHGVRESLKD